MKAPKNSGGFTILEMIVATALMLMLMGILFKVFQNADQVGRKTESWIEIHQHARSLFNFMERDLSGAVMVGIGTTNPRYFDLNDAIYEDARSTGDTVDDHDQDSLRFVSRTSVRYGEMAEVGYYLEDTSASDVRKNSVGRYIDYAGDDLPNGDDLDLSIDVWDNFKSKTAVASGVTDLNIRYWPSGGSAWTDPGGSWVTSLTALPKLIEITAYITDSKGIFLDGLDDANPFCGKGMKFVHVVKVGGD